MTLLPNFSAMRPEAVLAFLLKTGVFAQVERENRQRDRVIHREAKAHIFRQVALRGGGRREVARRQRQIAAGQLQVSA